MPIYAMFSTLTDEGRKTIKNNPGRVKEVVKESSEWAQKSLLSMQCWGSMIL
jgi:uncharacterized protein with GYD domain